MKTKCVAHVAYTLTDMERTFWFINSDGNRYSRVLTFETIERCKDVSRVDREVAFEFFRVERDASIEEVFDEMERNGLLPAIYEEARGFLNEYPNEQMYLEDMPIPIYVLGSETIVDGRRCITCLDEDGVRRNDHERNLDCASLVLNTRSIDSWGAHTTFLAVRENP